MQAAGTVDQIDETAVVEAHIVTLHSRCARRDIRHEGGDLARRVRVRDVDDAQAMSEPGDRNLSAADLLTELMHARVVLLGRTVLLGDLEAGKRDRLRLIRDVDNPEEGGRG